MMTLERLSMPILKKHFKNTFYRLELKAINLFIFQEKQHTIPEELGKDAKSVAALQRRHATFEHDLVTLGTQVSFHQ